jgi:hypothetical protein
VAGSRAFDAGGGTIAIVIIIIIALVIIVVLMGIFLFWMCRKHGNYKLKPNERALTPSDNIELGQRYTPAGSFNETTLTRKEKEAEGKINPIFSEEDPPQAFYTERGPEEDDHVEYNDTPKAQDQGPTELYTDMTLPAAEPIKKSEGETGSQDLLYTDMTPAPAAAPERPPKLTKPEPYKVPVKKEEESKPVQKPSPQCPPSPEMYIDMGGRTQEIHINQDTGGLSQDLYDDVQATPPQPPKKDDQAPLISQGPEDLYEDTEIAVTQAQEYIKTNRMSGAGFLPPVPTSPSRQSVTELPPPILPPRAPQTEQPPALPSRPVPKKRSSAQPLPETPLQKSLSGSSISSSSSQPTSPMNPTSPISVMPSVDAIYEDTAVLPPEESLYEPIPAREGNQQLIPQRQAAAATQPASKPGKGNKLKGKKGKK